MAINTYEESFFDTLKKNSKVVISILVALAVIVLAFLGIRYYLGKNQSATTADGAGLIRDYNQYVGNPNASIKLVYILDPQCPACRSNNSTMTLVKQYYSEKDIQIVYKFFPLPNHSMARPGAYASYAAAEQGKFFEYLDLVLERQDSLSNSTFEAIAQELDLNIDAWNSVRNSSSVRQKVDQDEKDVKAANLPNSDYSTGNKVGATPTTIIIKDNQIVQWWSGSPSSNPNEGFAEYQKRIDQVIQS